MEEQELFGRLEGILRGLGEVYGISQVIKNKQITPDTSLERDLYMDSLDRYEFLFKIEEELNVQIPDEKGNEMDTLKEIMGYLKESKQVFY